MSETLTTKYSKELAERIDLIDRFGAEYYLKQVENSKQCNTVYGIASVCIVLVSFVLRQSTVDPDSAQVLGIAVWILSAGLTLRTSLAQNNLLPFLGISKFAHYTATAILSLLGCAGILIYFAFKNYTDQAGKEIFRCIQLRNLDPEVQERLSKEFLKKDYLLEEPSAVSPEFEQWAAGFRTYTNSISGIHSIHDFPRSVILQAATDNLSPKDFFTKYFSRRLSDAERKLVQEHLTKQKAKGIQCSAPGVVESDYSKASDTATSLPTAVTNEPVPTSEESSQGVDSQSGKPATDLEKLFELYKAGAITEQEFTKLKKDV